MTLAPSAPPPYLRRSLIEARGAKRMGATLRPVSSVPVSERSALGLTRWAGALAYSSRARFSLPTRVTRRMFVALAVAPVSRARVTPPNPRRAWCHASACGRVGAPKTRGDFSFRVSQ